MGRRVGGARAGMHRVGAFLGLLLALGIGAAVRWTVPAQVEDLRPRPDALEYEEAARNLATGEGYSLLLDGGRYPPRYPPGFSLLLVPVVWLTGGVHGAGIWVVLASALAGIAGVWAIGLLTGGAASAVVAALLLALSPLHVRWSRAVMSDVPTSTATALLALGAILCLRRDVGRLACLALGIAMGLAALLRTTCTLLAVPTALMLLGRGRVAPLLAFGAGVAIGLLPTAAYDVARFGSPLASGYEYWVAADFFGWASVTGRPAGGGTESNLVFYGRLLAGLGSLWSWPVAVLIATGLVLALRRPGAPRVLAGLAAGMTLVLLAVYLPFFWQWDRFLLPLVPIGCALAAIPVGSASPPWLRVTGVLLAATALVGAWGTPGAFAPPDRPLGEVAALRAIAASVEPNAALIARSNVVLVSRLFHDDTQRLWIPVDRCEHRALIRDRKLAPYAPAREPQNWVWDVIGPVFDPAAVEAAIEALLASGRPVYYSPILSFQTPLSMPLGALLRAHFRLEPVTTAIPTGLVRVRPAA